MTPPLADQLLALTATGKIVWEESASFNDVTFDRLPTYQGSPDAKANSKKPQTGLDEKRKSFQVVWEGKGGWGGWLEVVE